MQKFKASLYLDINKAKGVTPKEKENSKCPIYLRIYIDGKRTMKATGHEIEPKFWDKDKELVKSTCRNAQIINTDINLKKDEIVKKLVVQQVNGKAISIISARQSLQPSGATNIFTFVNALIIDLRGREKRSDGTLENYRKHLEKLRIYHGTDDLTFEEITADYLAKYELYLKQDEEVGVSANYTHALIKTLRSFFNIAINRKIITWYPFKGEGYEFPEYNGPTKDYLTREELRQWEDLIPELKTTNLYQTAIYFLFACYCGMRISDWYPFNKSNVSNDWIRAIAIKNKKPITVPISTPLQRGIDRVFQTKLIDREAKVNEKLKTLATRLKIDKHITAHTARHTFAVTVCLGNKVSSETAAEMMGITLKTFVEAYSQVTEDKILRETSTAWSNLK